MIFEFTGKKFNEEIINFKESIESQESLTIDFKHMIINEYMSKEIFDNLSKVNIKNLILDFKTSRFEYNPKCKHFMFDNFRKLSKIEKIKIDLSGCSIRNYFDNMFKMLSNCENLDTIILNLYACDLGNPIFNILLNIRGITQEFCNKIIKLTVDVGSNAINNFDIFNEYHRFTNIEILTIGLQVLCSANIRPLSDLMFIARLDKLYHLALYLGFYRLNDISDLLLICSGKLKYIFLDLRGIKCDMEIIKYIVNKPLLTRNNICIEFYNENDKIQYIEMLDNRFPS
jgi:hypothetical protein